ncbi:MAG: FG-GAP-like repeat-containing protein [Pseudomonadota bacterium]
MRIRRFPTALLLVSLLFACGKGDRRDTSSPAAAEPGIIDQIGDWLSGKSSSMSPGFNPMSVYKAIPSSLPPVTFDYRDVPVGTATYDSMKFTTSSWPVPTQIPSTSYMSALFHDMKGRRVFTGDFDGDGKTDLLHVNSYNQIGGTNTYRTIFVLYRSDGTGGFEVKARENNLGTLNEFYALGSSNRAATPAKYFAADFNGDGITDLLEMKDYSRVGTSLADPHAILWVYDSGTGLKPLFKPGSSIEGFPSPYSQVTVNGSYPASLYSSKRKGSWLVADLNRDGKADLIHIMSKGHPSVRTWLSWSTDTQVSFDVSLDWQTATYSCTGYSNLCLNSGTTSPDDPNPGSATIVDPGELWKMGDFNGDGSTDLLHLYEDPLGKMHLWRWDSNATSFSVGELTNPDPNVQVERLHTALTADFNGDGVTDQLFPTLRRLWFGNGAGFDLFDVGDDSETSGFCGGEYTACSNIGNLAWVPRELIGATDLNRDGKTDLFYTISPTMNGNNGREIHFLTYDSKGQFRGHKTIVATGTDRNQEQFVQFGDFDGDSKADILSVVDGSTPASFSDCTNLPSGATCVPCAGVPGWGSFCGGGFLFQYACGQTQNFTGTFLGTLGCYHNNSYYGGTVQGGVPQAKIDLHRDDPFGGTDEFPRDNLLVSVTKEMGGAEKATYGVISQQAGDPVLRNSFPVVTKTSIYPHGLSGSSFSQTFEYKRATWLSPKGRFLGFATWKGTDSRGGIKETAFRLPTAETASECMFGGEGLNLTKDSDGKIISATRYDYTDADTGNGLCSSHTTSTRVYACEGSTTSALGLDNPALCKQVRTDFEYDEYGNEKKMKSFGEYQGTTTDLLPEDNTVTFRLFNPNKAAFIVNLPFYVSIISVDGNGTPISKLTYTEFLYDHRSVTQPPLKGLPTKISRWISGTTYAHTETTYDTQGRPLTVKDPDGYITTVAYDSEGRLQSTTDPGGHVTQTSWTVFGEVEIVGDPNGITVTNTYDKLGRKFLESYANGSFVQFQYLNVGNPCLAAGEACQRTRVARSDGSSDGLWSEDYFDGLGRIYETRNKSTTSLDYVVQKSTYVDASTLQETSTEWFDSATGIPSVSLFTYDTIGRLKTVKVDGVTETLLKNNYADKRGTFDLACTTVTDASNHATASCKEKLVSKVIEYDGTAIRTTTTTSNPLIPKVEVADPLGNVSSTTFDRIGRILQTTDPDRGTIRFTYTSGGRPLTRTDAKNQTIAFQYDTEGRPAKKIYPNGSQVVFTYGTDAAARNVDRITTVTYPGGSETFNYDDMGRKNIETRSVGAHTIQYRYFYDIASRPSHLVIPAPIGITVDYQYDAAGRLQSVPGYVDQISYWPQGMKKEIRLANGAVTTYDFEPDKLRRLKSIETVAWKDAAHTERTTIFKEQIDGYEADGRIKTITSTTHPAFNWNVTYDDLHRVTGVTGGINESYSYDPLGRITSHSANGAYQYTNPAHLHAVTKVGSRTYGYDANGNMTKAGCRTVTVGDETQMDAPALMSLLPAKRSAGGGTTTVVCDRVMTWDPEDRLASVQGGGWLFNFDYDANGNRIRKGSRLYFGNRVERTSGGEYITYIYAGPERVARVDSQGKHYYHTDHLFSARATTNSQGLLEEKIDYTPFGRKLRGQNSVQGFAGGDDDELGLTYLSARYYDPKIGRFLSADSIVPYPGSQSLDRYAYARNNPVNSIDPSGHVDESHSSYFSSGPADSDMLSRPAGVGPPCAGARAVCEMFHGPVSEEFASRDNYLREREQEQLDSAWAGELRKREEEEKKAKERVPTGVVEIGPIFYFTKLVTKDEPVEGPCRGCPAPDDPGLLTMMEEAARKGAPPSTTDRKSKVVDVDLLAAITDAEVRLWTLEAWLSGNFTNVYVVDNPDQIGPAVETALARGSRMGGANVLGILGIHGHGSVRRIDLLFALAVNGYSDFVFDQDTSKSFDVATLGNFNWGLSGRLDLITCTLGKGTIPDTLAHRIGVPVKSTSDLRSPFGTKPSEINWGTAYKLIFDRGALMTPVSWRLSKP